MITISCLSPIGDHPDYHQDQLDDDHDPDDDYDPDYDQDHLDGNYDPDDYDHTNTDDDNHEHPDDTSKNVLGGCHSQ